MTTAGYIALAITVSGAFGYAAASILQAVGARRSTGAVKAMGHPLYIVGTICDLLAWAGSMVALRELAVYLVESVLAGSLAVTVVAARIFLRSRLRGVDALAVVVSVVSLVVLAMSAGTEQTVVATSQMKLWFCVAAPVLALLGWAATKLGKPGVVAALAGLSLGGAALVGRILPMPASPMSDLGATVLGVLTEPLTGALLVLGITGMTLYASALQNGQVGAVTAVLWIAEVIAPSSVALLLLGDTVRPGWDMAAAVAGVVTVGAAVVLATAPGNYETVLPSEEDEFVAQPALTYATRHALPQAPIPAMFRPSPHGERIIWWGPSPIWVPPARTTAALAAYARPQTAGRRPVPRVWPDPQPALARAETPAPFRGKAAVRSQGVAAVPRRRPWDDL